MKRKCPGILTQTSKKGTNLEIRVPLNCKIKSYHSKSLLSALQRLLESFLCTIDLTSVTTLSKSISFLLKSKRDEIDLFPKSLEKFNLSFSTNIYFHADKISPISLDVFPEMSKGSHPDI